MAVLSCRCRRALKAYGTTLFQLRFAIVTVMVVLALAFVMNLSGQTITLGTWMAGAGGAFALLSPVLGWLGVAVTGSDTSSNSLFGALQVTAANQAGLSDVLMAASNSSGGVLGKMISPQNLAIAAAAVGMNGKEGDIFRRVVVVERGIPGAAVRAVGPAGVCAVVDGAVTPGRENGWRPSYFELVLTAVSASASVGYSSKIWSSPVSSIGRLVEALFATTAKCADWLTLVCVATRAWRPAEARNPTWDRSMTSPVGFGIRASSMAASKAGTVARSMSPPTLSTAIPSW